MDHKGGPTTYAEDCLMTLSELCDAIDVELKLDRTVVRSETPRGTKWKQRSYTARVEAAPKPYFATLKRRGTASPRTDLSYANVPDVAHVIAMAMRAHFAEPKNIA